MIRRIVTGHSEAGKPVVLKDGRSLVSRSAAPGITTTLIWCSDRTPADIPVGTGIEDMGERAIGTPPPVEGTKFSVIDFAPGNEVWMHRTDTLDYVIVLHGEIDMDMDDSTVRLAAGDIMVQRGTDHAWVNRSKENARVAFVMVDAKPLGIGNPVCRP